MSSDEYALSSKRTRASGEVLDFLLQEFESNHNPSPEQRKEISDKTNMSEKAVRIWFQNRRAKLRKFERLGKIGEQSGQKKPGNGGSSRSSASSYNEQSNTKSSPLTEVFISINEKYCFIDCTSLSVGSWQRIKTGEHDEALLKNDLINLSPFTLNKVMENVDLFVLLSRKNLEINYFFSAIANNSKVLFRIFYPISSIIKCSLLDNNISKDNNELRLCLSQEPKFSVYFFNGVNANSNQWSICEDFSEGQQVSDAHGTDGDETIPHVLVGVKNSLQYLNSFILENNQIAHPTTNYHPHIQINSSHFDEETPSTGNFQFNTDEQALWDNDNDSPLEDFDANSSSTNTLSHRDQAHVSRGSKGSISSNLNNGEDDYSYNPMFSSNTPEFFESHTPASGSLNATLAANETHDENKNNVNLEPGVMHDTSDLHSYTHQSQFNTVGASDIFPEDLAQINNNDSFEFVAASDFPPLENQVKNNYSSNSSANNQIDSFIDYNE